MKTLMRTLAALLLSIIALQAQAIIDVVELNQPNANKVVFKVRFKNGSIADPADKKGLTYATASLMSQGGAGDMSYPGIQDKMLPWAAQYGAMVDKQVT